MGAKTLFLIGALAFWLPEIVLYAWTRQALNGKLVTFLLPGSFLLTYLLVSILRPKQIPRPSGAVFMVMGTLFLGTLAMTIGATIRGAGFWGHPGSTLLGVLLGTVIPIYAFIAATYDGSLYALIFVSVLMPLIHLLFERQNWIIPPKKAESESVSGS
jgi:Na+-translocating ferredoxin:NAD+ oxidoreductase RnfD subunit